MTKQIALEQIFLKKHIHCCSIGVIAVFEEYKMKNTKKELDNFGINTNQTRREFILELSPVVPKKWSKIDKFKNRDWEMRMREKKKSRTKLKFLIKVLKGKELKHWVQEVNKMLKCEHQTIQYTRK